MNDKDFEELAQGLFGLYAETLQEKLTEDKPTKAKDRELTLQLADGALEYYGFKNTLIVAEDDEGFGLSMPENHIVAAHLILAALERAPLGTLEHVFLHFGKVGGKQ